MQRPRLKTITKLEWAFWEIYGKNPRTSAELSQFIKSLREKAAAQNGEKSDKFVLKAVALLVRESKELREDPFFESAVPEVDRAYRTLRANNVSYYSIRSALPRNYFSKEEARAVIPGMGVK